MNERQALQTLRSNSIEIGPEDTRSIIEIAIAHNLGNVALQKYQNRI